MSSASQESVIEEVVVEDVCSLEVEICEQLALMAQENGEVIPRSQCKMPESTTHVGNMPAITAGTEVQLISPPLTSHQGDSSTQVYLVDQNGLETMIQVPSALLYSDTVNAGHVTLPYPMKQQPSLAKLIHSYAACETDKETNINDASERMNLDGNKSSSATTGECTVEKNHDLNYKLPSDSSSTSDVAVQSEEHNGEDVNKVMVVPGLSSEPVSILKSIPYGMLSGNTLTLLQQSHGNDTPPLAANVGGMCREKGNIPLINKHRLRRRIVTEPGQMPYVCDICDKGFSHAYNLKLHLRAHLDDRPHICPICSKGFLQATKLKNHMTTHTKEKKYQCQVCKKMFGYQESLKKHARVHSGEKSFTCTICHKQFAWLNVLNSHMSTHSNEKRFICDVCGKSFTYKTSLKSHMQRHDGGSGADLRCEICEHSFMYPATLKRHIAGHIKDTLHKCHQCDKQFSSIAILNRHSHIHDASVHGYLCSLCIRSFPRLQDLEDHLQNHYPDRKHVCDVCGKGFVHVRGLKQHVKLHSPVMKYFCPSCDKGFQHRGNLTMHVRSHTGEKPYSCSLCHKTFTGSSSLRRHSRLHSGERPYVCRTCNKCFSDSTRLNKHNKTVHENSVVVYEVQEIIAT